MSRWATKLYPCFLAFVPFLYFAGKSPDQFKFAALALMLVTAVVGCALVYALTALAMGRRGPASLPPFVALLAVAWFYGYPRVAGALSGQAVHTPHPIVIPACLAASAALVWWIRRRERLLDGVGRFFTLMGALLVGWSTLQIGAGWLRGRTAITGSALAGELARPIEGPASALQPRRDIYLIVLDEYAHSDVLREHFGHENRPFEDSLRALGFHVPRLVRSNYLHTLLSLPSMLNSAHLAAGLGNEISLKSRHPGLPNYLLEHNRVTPYLEARGYRYVFFPSQWWHSTRRSSVADSEFRPWTGFDLTREMSRGELERTVAGGSVLRYLDRDHRWEADHVRQTFRALADVPGAGGPVFAFAHILKPHDPYVFDRDCRTLAREKEVDDVGPYIVQLECLNRLLLDTVREILRTSEVPPIIILQGDHGTKLLGATGYARAGEVPPAAARERFGAFGAYYLPDGGAAEFGDTVTVVNVLGNVLRHYFGAHLPREGDEQYISPADFPYEFRRVDARWLAGDDSAGPELRAGR